MSSSSSFEKKLLDDNSLNPKYVDLCDEDPPIAGQKFACMSFISPEKVLKQREVFFFQQFLKQWDFSKSMDKFLEFLHFASYKYNLNVDDVIVDFNEFVKEEGAKLKAADISDDFKNFMDKQEDKLHETFQRENNFQTSVRGLKIRGIYSNNGSWVSKRKETNTQIDLLIDRDDQVINLCEMKFSNQAFTIDKRITENMIEKINVFKTETKTNKGIFLTFITTFGLKKNSYSNQIVQNELSMDALFTSL